MKLRNLSRIALWDDLWPTFGEQGLAQENIPVRFKIRQDGDLWEVTRDGRPSGGYISHAGALAAARIAIQGVFRSGGAAELRGTRDLGQNIG